VKKQHSLHHVTSHLNSKSDIRKISSLPHVMHPPTQTPTGSDSTSRSAHVPSPAPRQAQAQRYPHQGKTGMLVGLDEGESLSWTSTVESKVQEGDALCCWSQNIDAITWNISVYPVNVSQRLVRGRHFSTGHLWQECRYRLTGGSLAFDFRLLDGNFVSIFKNLRLEDAAFGFSKHMWPLRR
jgi:hypothetical protein